MVRLEDVYQILRKNDNQGLDAEAIAALVSTQNQEDPDPILPCEIKNLVRREPYHFLVSEDGLIFLKHPTLR